MAAIKQYVSEPGGEYHPVPQPANDNLPQVELLSYREYKERRGYDTTVEAIAELLRVGTLASINARPSRGKTGIAIYVANILVGGDDFLGRATRPCSVAYIPVEDANDVANRLHAIENEAIKIVDIADGFSLGSNFKKSVEAVRFTIRQLKEKSPDRIPIVAIDTLRSALEGLSVLDDRNTSPPLNALRKVAEDEGAIIVILNHTNRDNPRHSKGETLESLVSTEIILVDQDDGWLEIWVGKNRSGRANHLLGKVKFTSIENDDGSKGVIVDDIISVDEADVGAKSADNLTGDRKILHEIIHAEIGGSSRTYRPYGNEGDEVTVVSVKTVRDAFYKRKEASPEARKKAFTRHLRALLESQKFVRGEMGDDAVLWLPSRAKEAQAKTGPGQ